MSSTIPKPGSHWFNTRREKVYQVLGVVADCEDEGDNWEVIYRSEDMPPHHYRRRSVESWYGINRHGQPRFVETHDKLRTSDRGVEGAIIAPITSEEMRSAIELLSQSPGKIVVSEPPEMTFNLQSAIDAQQQLVLSLQTKASNGIEGATAELASAIAGLRDLQAMASKPQPSSPQNLPVTPPYQIR